MTETPTVTQPRRVVVGGARDVERVLRDINAAIVAFNWSSPTVFIYQNQLHWLDEHSGNGSGPLLRPLDLNLLRGVCSLQFQCVTPDRPVAGTAEEPVAEDAAEEAEADDGVERVTGPTFSRAKAMPSDVALMLLATPMYWQGIPHLHSMVNLPFYRADGSLCEEHGYDEDSHIFYFKPRGFDLPRPVPEEPGVEAVEWARHWLCEELFVDFPFASDADRANTVAMLLSPFVMQMFDCPLPLFVLTADNPGVGKSLLAEIVGRVLTGAAVTKAPWPKVEEEFEKKIFSVLSAGTASPMVVWDNVAEGTAVDSPVLAALHTAREYSGRTLGKSEWRTFRNDKIWAVTGNALGTSGDMARRSVYCALAADGPHPEDRPPESFRHPRIRQWIDANRATLVLACLTLVRAWQHAGEPMPAASVPRMGDYAPWVETVGGILAVADVPGFLGNVRERREMNDAGVGEASALFEIVAQRFGATTSVHEYPGMSVSFTSNEVADALRKLDADQRESMQFPPVIDKWVGNMFAPNEKALASAIGRWFGRQEGRWQGDSPSRRIIYLGSRQKIKFFQLEERYDGSPSAGDLPG